jgi:hypothetical protein
MRIIQAGLSCSISGAQKNKKPAAGEGSSKAEKTRNV